jgi:His/Glu/Gln/Arg/opine family amino acid ABC transporter permease subunit
VSRFEFQWDAVLQRWDWLATGLAMNVYISAASMAIALVLGLVVAVLRMAPLPLVPLVAQLYINIFRAIPLFVFIIWLYYGLPIMLGINFPPVTAGVICLSMQYAGWLAEIYRAGIGAIPRGQREAALSLGLTPLQAFRDVVFPQALRIIVPPIGNNFVGMLKDSSLVSIIGVFELVRQANLAVSLTFRPFEFYTVVAVLFIVLTQLLSHGVTRLERRMRI